LTGCVLAIFVWVAATGARADPPSGLVFVSNEQSSGITIIDPSKDSAVVGEIKSCGRPRHMAWSLKPDLFYVACGDSNAIGLVDARTRKMADTIPFIEEPEAFAMSADGKFLYVSNEEDAALSVVDLQSRTTVAWIDIGVEPEGVMLDRDGQRVWVTSEASNMVHVIDTKTNKVLKDILVDTRPRRLAETPDGKEVWVSCEVAGRLDIIDPKALEPVGHVDFAPRGFRREYLTPVDITMTRDGKTAYVALGRANHVAVVDVPTRQVRDYILVGSRPWGLRLNADETILYVANGLSDDVSIIDTKSLRVRKSVPVGRVPYGILIDDRPPAPADQP
jgi:PQQ-dependent catabolism-associated beta-propeller protein